MENPWGDGGGGRGQGGDPVPPHLFDIDFYYGERSKNIVSQ